MTRTGSLVFIYITLFLTSCAVKIPLQESAASPPPGPASPLIQIEGPEEGFNAAMDAFRIKDTETTALVAGQVVEQYPNTPWQKRSLFLMGRAFILLDRPQEAEAAMVRASTEYPELADYAVYLLAEYFFSKARYEDAIRFYDKLIAEHRDSFHMLRSSLKKAEALFESGAYPRATEAFDDFLNDYPRSEFCPDAALGLARSLFAEGKTGEAVRAYKEVRIKYPINSFDAEAEKELEGLRGQRIEIPEFTADEFYERGRNLFKSSQYEKAYEAFGSLLEIDPAYSQKTDALIRSGIALFHLGRRSEAAAMLERLVREHPLEERRAEALNWLGKTYAKLGRKDDAIGIYLRLLSSYPESELADDTLYLLGSIYRESNDIKNAVKFYDRLSSNYPASKFADSAIWWKAWAQYGAGDFNNAAYTLQELIRRYPKSFLVNQALYWQGRAAGSAGDSARAAIYHRRVLARGPYTYYGYLASERLKKFEGMPLEVKADESTEGNQSVEYDNLPDAPQEANDIAGPPVWTDEAKRSLSSDPSFKKILELMHLNMKKEAASELWSLQERVPRRRGALIGLSKTFFELGDYYRSLIIVLRNYERYLEGGAKDIPDDFWLLAYPQGLWESILTYSQRYNVDPYFTAAIIREESQFHTEAQSPAGARGVMQVMPSTAEWIAQTIRMPGFDKDRLYDQATNINLGAWYIGHLMKRFKGDVLLVSAAYNAGPEAAASWISRNGNSAERDVFVESIPFSETRGYVKKVMRNYFEYKRIYGRSAQKAVLTPIPPIDAADSASMMKGYEVMTP